MTVIQWNDILGWTPGMLQSFRSTAFLFLKEGKYDHARPYFEALVLLDPQNHYDLRALGVTLFYQGDFKQAITYFEKALHINPYHLPTHLNHTKALLALGMNAEGMKAAKILQRCGDAKIADDASALILAYG